MYRVAEAWPQGGTLAAQWAAIVASAFIVARGMNNYDDASAKRE